MNSILENDLFLFDLDGTIIDSEHIHYQCYLTIIKNISFDDYCRFKHGNQPYDHTVDEKKQILFMEYLNNPNNMLNLINGFEQFFNTLLLYGKKICIVTNASTVRINAIKSKVPLLNKIIHWITKDNCISGKPSSECYIKAINMFNVPPHKIIIFEDSYNGYLSMISLQTNKIILNNKNYIYYNDMTCDNKFDDYTDMSKYIHNHDGDIDYISNKIDLYTSQINFVRVTLEKNVKILYQYMKNNTNTIYLIGIGKNNHIAHKCASTLNSYGIKIEAVVAQDLLHGGFGTFSKNDLLIYISNSGNTNELVEIAKYVKDTFKYYQISVCNNANSLLKQYVNLELIIHDGIVEADDINMAPTVSSTIFMMLFDLCGVYYAKKNNYDKALFKKYHPGGMLGCKKVIDTIFIFVAGNGSRLMPYTKNLPKILINVDNDNILHKIIMYWKRYTDNFTLIVNEQHVKIINYCMKQLDVQYHIVPDVAMKGTAHAIKHLISNNYDGKKILFLWSDIYIDIIIDENIFKDKNIIFTCGNKCRYFAEKNNIVKRNDGNIMGIYYFHNYKQLQCDDNMDLCDCYMANYPIFDTYDVDIVDVGDNDKLLLHQMKSTYITRSFNKLFESDGKLIKKTSGKGIPLMENEQNMYKILSSDLCPIIYEYGSDYMIMEKLHHKPLHKFEINNHILNQLLITLNKIHDVKQIVVDKSIIDKDLNYEFNEKIKSRIKDIRPLLDLFEITHINNRKILHTFDHIVEHLWSNIGRINVTTYNVIHGDCQFSNIMYDGTTFKFIDFRGYFGYTKIFGIKEYDISKIMYALSGYDDFNNCPMHLNIDDKNITINIQTKLDLYINIFGTDKKILLSMMIMHWFGLSQYIKNDIAKSIMAYYNAIYLYHLYIL